MKARIAASIWIVFSGLSCSLNEQGDRDVASALEEHELNRSQLAKYDHIPSTHPSSPTSMESRKHSIPLTGDLRSLLLRGLDENPRIRSAVEKARAMAKRIPQQTTLPDPMLSTRTFIGPMMLADGNNVFVLGVSQQIPFPETLERRGTMVLEETRMAIQDLNIIRRQIVSGIKATYYRIYITDRTIEVTEENRNLLQGLVEVVQAQVVSGKRSQADLLRIQVELAEVKKELVELRQKRISLEANMNSLVNLPIKNKIPLTKEFEFGNIKEGLLFIHQLAEKNNSELRKLQHQIERDRQSVRLAKLGYLPEFRVGFEWMAMEPRTAWRPPIDLNTGMRPAYDDMSEEAKDNYAIMVEMTLPIWLESRNAAVHEAEHNLSASLHDFQTMKNQITWQLEDAQSEILAQKEIFDILTQSIIPQAKKTYELSQTGYTAGTDDFQIMIENLQKWLNFRIQNYRAKGTLGIKLADMEAMITDF
jgi:outer membrane protein TolC